MHGHMIIVIEHYRRVVMPGTLGASPGQFMNELQNACPLVLPSVVGHSQPDLGVQPKETTASGGRVKAVPIVFEHSSSGI
eukprot:818337-Amphidinium_carterae.1